jgi:anti-anti-sigma factor
MELLRQESGVVRVTGDLHISEAEQLRSVLLRELAAPTLVLELYGVQSCDTASLQLLCALHKSAQRDGKQFRITSASPAVSEAAALLGLSLEDLAGASFSN